MVVESGGTAHSRCGRRAAAPDVRSQEAVQGRGRGALRHRVPGGAGAAAGRLRAAGVPLRVLRSLAPDEPNDPLTRREGDVRPPTSSEEHTSELQSLIRNPYAV